LVHDRLVDLHGPSRVPRWRSSDEETNLLDSRRRTGKRHVDETVDSDASVEEAAYERVLQLGGGGSRKARVEVVGGEAAAPRAERRDIARWWRGADDDRVLLVADVDDPDQLRGIGAFLADRLVGDDC